MTAPATVFAAFAAAAARHGGRPFLNVPREAARAYSDSAIELTYADVMDAAENRARSYRAAGYGPGHKVALVLENRPCFFAHFLALNAVGACAVPVSAEMSAAEMAYLIGHSDAELVVTLPEHARKVADALQQVGHPVALCREGEDALASPYGNGMPGISDAAAILYTSGTTGKPKGCVLSNEYFLAAGALYANQDNLCSFAEGAERLITPLPLNHSNALVWSFMAMVKKGGCIIQLDRFRPSSWWPLVRESRATVLHYLGVMPAMLLAQPAAADDDFSGQIRFGFGAGVDPRHHAAFEARFGFPLIEAWAMTETGAGAWIAANREPRHVGSRCFGRPEAGLAVKLVDEEGREVPTGAPGELLVRRKTGDPRRYFFSSYYKDPAATREAWDGDWFHTGDVVRMDGAGNLFFVDRRKNIIRRSGENIAAVEVESVLARHPLVHVCAVAPVADEIRGEEVAALVILREDVAPSAETAEEIFAFAGGALAYFKLPGYVAFVSALPMTASQKIQRGELKKLASDLVARGTTVDLRTRKRRPKAVALQGEGHG